MLRVEEGWIPFESVSHSVVSDSMWRHGLYPARLFCPRNSPGKNTGVGSHVLLQGIFPTQGLNLGLPHCRQILYCLSQQESPASPIWGTKYISIEWNSIILFISHLLLASDSVGIPHSSWKLDTREFTGFLVFELFQIFLFFDVFIAM